MKKLLLLIFISALCVNAQSPWLATNTPTALRFDDVNFINQDTGWAVSSTGFIYNTKNGGTNWAVQKSTPGSYMRSIEFSNARKGFAGALEGGGSNVFFKTTDGGATWTDISSVITGTNRGICGICCVDTNITYAVGVWSSPAYVMKTTNGGVTWTQMDMSAYASRLVDVQFKDANNGYVTGQSNIPSEGAVILKTTNGGATWTKVFTNNLAGNTLWKIQNLDNTHWYASIEKSAPGWNVFLKSKDGGNSWTSKNVSYYSANFLDYFQVVGFLDTLRGWTGGRVLWQTIDGGNSWIAVDSASGSQHDRFQKINSNVAYLTADKVYKLQSGWAGIKEEKVFQSQEPKLKVFPNPTKNNFTISLTVTRKTIYNLRIINALANKIEWDEVGQKDFAGEYQFKVNQKLAAGEYFVYVMTNEGQDCKKIIILE